MRSSRPDRLVLPGTRDGALATCSRGAVTAGTLSAPRGRAPGPGALSSPDAATDARREPSPERAFLAYTRIAALAFLLVTGYTLFAKVPGGDIRDDWLHTVLHFVTGLVALSIGWVLRSVATARVFTVAVGIGYGGLGIAGWFTDGLFLTWEFAVPLAAADNVFHLFLAGAATTALAISRRRQSSPIQAQARGARPDLVPPGGGGVR